MDQISATGQVITLIHFTHAVPRDGGEDWRIACMPNMTEFGCTRYHPHYSFSNDTRAVSCPACKKTPQFRAAADNLASATGAPYTGWMNDKARG